jgi:subtilisin family serine protease
MVKQTVFKRTGTRRFLIGVVIFLCAQFNMAGAEDITGNVLSELYSINDLAYSGQGGELIVKFTEEGQSQMARSIPGPVSRKTIRNAISGGVVSGASVEKVYDNVVSGLSLIRIPEGTSLTTALIRFNCSENVSYAEPNYKYNFMAFPNDPDFGKQWALHNTGQNRGKVDADIDAPEAWDIETGNQDVIIAVIDSGVDYLQLDLRPNFWVNFPEVLGSDGVDDDGNGYIDDLYGYDFVNDDAIPDDELYHGTHVAGIIGANGNNLRGVSGVCWEISLMILKIGTETIDVATAIEAIQYAVGNGAKIINMSWAQVLEMLLQQQSNRELSVWLRQVMNLQILMNLQFIRPVFNLIILFQF